MTSSSKTRWSLPIALIALTFLSTMYVGAGMEGIDVRTPTDLLRGWGFSLALMAILLSHEFGHFIAGRRNGVDVSPPFFIPMPFFLLGTLGAVIRIRKPITNRNALFDVGAAGPLAGILVALPILFYGLTTSAVELLPAGESNYIIEGRSILYSLLVMAIKGPIPDGYDIMLNPVAFAGWAGLLVTMINLLPVGQLDGGHVAYALVGERQNLYSERIRKLLPFIGLLVGAAYGVPAWLRGDRGLSLLNDWLAGVHWLVWAVVLWWMTRVAGTKHPPTEEAPLTSGRRRLGLVILVLFGLIFMPSWVRQP